MQQWLIQLEGTMTNVEKIKCLQRHMKELLEVDNGYWRQRSRSNWFLNRDHSTAYFHQRVSHHHLQNRICKIKDTNGELATLP